MRPDFARLGVVNDVLGRAARPLHIGLTGFQRCTHGVHAGHKGAVHAQHVVYRAAHTRHDALVHRHIGAVGQLDADVGNVRAQRAHGKGHHVHGASLHTAVEQGFLAVIAGLQQGAHLGRGHPVVGGAGVFFILTADEGAVFHAGHIAGVGTGQETVGAFGRVKALEGAGVNQLLAQALVLFLRAVAPVNRLGFAQGGHFGDPGDQARVLHIAGGVQRESLHTGRVHGMGSRVLKIDFSKQTRADFEKATAVAREVLRTTGVANSMNRYLSYQAITGKSYA